jgi:tyrosine-protein kinase Etk/Wzc
MTEQFQKQFSSAGNGQLNQRNGEHHERQVTFHDYLRVLYRGRLIIAISFLVVVAATLYFTFTTEPVYEASAKLMVEEQGGVGESLFDITSMMKKETMINNQVEILKSRTLAERVIRNLKISSHAGQLRTLTVLKDEDGKSNSIIGFIKSLLPQDKQSDENQQDEFDTLVEGLRENINVNPIRNTDMIEIKVSAFSPFEAAFISNMVASTYQNMNQEQSQQEVRQVKNFLEEQLDQYQKELTQSEDALKNYQEQAKVVALDQETAELVQKLAEFETLYNEAKTEYQANIQRLDYIDDQLEQKNVNLDVDAISSEPYLAELKKQIAEKEAKLIKIRASLVELDDYSNKQLRNQVQMEQSQLEALKEKFKQEVTKIAASQFVDPAQLSGSLFASKIEVETELQSLEPKVKSLEKIVEKYNDELEELPEKSIRLARLMRKRQVGEKIYIMLQEKYQESRITEVGQLGNVRIIDPAIPPKYPVKPKKRLNLILGVLVGLGLGVGIAFVREYLDNSVQNMEDVESLGLAIMATIPYIKPEEGNGMLSRIRIESDPDVEDINERLITHLKPRSPISEAYRTLRTNILFSHADQPKRVLMVTSSGPKEGKSTTVSNLAITFAQMGNRTLLIDADLRRPILHKLFGLDKHVGLTNVLVGRASLPEAVKRLEDLPNLDILNCGIIPPNPAELLGSENMQDVLNIAKETYNIILVDTPPTIAVTDASILAPIMDGVLLVIRAGNTQRDAARRAFEQLSKVGAPVMGSVLNSIKASNVYGSYYYHYHYHYYDDIEHDKNKKKKLKRTGKKQRI